ncbi:hypothetical protein L7F22_047006 [Adiantum nelumboides]|nr:hypothetical protein [Adiantum nelumboides]
MAPRPIPKTLLHVSVIILFLNLPSSSTACYAPDRASLLSFAGDVGFDGATLVLDDGSGQPWRGDDCCSWVGVTCTGATSVPVSVRRVTELKLHFGKAVSLWIPPSLCNLSALTGLHLQYSILGQAKEYFRISDCVGAHLNLLSFLQLFLYIGANVSLGTIPASFSSLSNLQDLVVQGLYIESHESLLSLVSTSSLVAIDLTSSSLPPTSLPILITTLPKLASLTLLGCNLYGPLPSFNNTSLKILDLTENSLNSTLEKFVLHSNLPALSFFRVARNSDLSGSIPTFTSLPNLTVLDLSDCSFSGSIPTFTSLPKLTQLDLSGCSLSGPVPSFKNTPLLKYLDLRKNSLNSTLENFFLHSNLPALSYFSAGYNRLSGSLPDFTREGFVNLGSILLNSNHLSGSVNFSTLSQLDYLDLSDNHLSGPFPSLQRRVQVGSLRKPLQQRSSGKMAIFVPAQQSGSFWQQYISHQ